MRKWRPSYLFLLCLLWACGDSTSPDETSNNGNNGGNGFTIVALDRDTVLWEDTVIVTLKNATADSFTAFVHTIPLAVDSVWRDAQGNTRIQMVIPLDASTGLVRIYEHDTVQASGDRVLTVRPRLRSSIDPQAIYFEPKRAYTGDLVVIGGMDFNYAEQAPTVSVNGVQLPVLSFDSVRVFTRVTPEMQSGPLTVTLDKKTFTLDTIRKLEHGKTLQLNGSLRRFQFTSSGLLGTTIVNTISAENDTLKTPHSAISAFDVSCIFSEITFMQRGDSLIGLANPEQGPDKPTLELRLKQEPESRVSGFLHVRVVNGSEWKSIDIRIKNMRWTFENGGYRFASRSIDLASEVIAYTHRIGAPFLLIETSDYSGGSASGQVTFDFR